MYDYYQCDPELVLSKFSLDTITPSSYTTDVVAKAKAVPQPVIKKFHQQYLSNDLQLRCLYEPQNSSWWEESRKGSIGSSDAAALCGLGGQYKDNVDCWLEHTGRVAPNHLKYSDEFFAMDRGHAFEPEAGNVYGAIMNMHLQDMGMLFHPTLPYVHVSADLLVQNQCPQLIHNAYTIRDSLFFVGEIKNPMGHCYKTRGPLPPQNTIPTTYIPQVCLQMDTLQADHLDFIAHWKCNPLVGPHLVDKADEYRYLVGEHRITKLYRNNDAIERVKACITRHLAQCLNNPSLCFPLLMTSNECRSEARLPSIVLHHPLQFQKGDISTEWQLFDYSKLKKHDEYMIHLLSQPFSFALSYIAPELSRVAKLSIQVFDKKHNSNVRVARDEWLTPHTYGDFRFVKDQENTFILSKSLIRKLLSRLREFHNHTEQQEYYLVLCVDFAPRKLAPLTLDPSSPLCILPEKEAFFETVFDPPQPPPEERNDKRVMKKAKKEVEAPPGVIVIDPATGRINGKIQLRINHLHEQKPLLKTMEQLASESSEAIELNSSYVLPPHPLARLQNPFLQTISSMYPDRHYRESLFDMIPNKTSLIGHT